MQKLMNLIANRGFIVLNCPVKIFSRFRQVLFQVGVPLFLVTVIGSALDRLITLKMENLLLSSDGTSPWIWLYGFLSLALNLIYPLLAVLLILSSLQSEPLGRFIKRTFEQSLIELMRSWGSAMLWSLLFVIPGLIRWTQYLLVPFIVCFDPDYQHGHKDALKTAREKSRGNWLKLFGTFLFFSIVLPVFMTGFDEWKLIWATPIPALIICFVEMLFNICFILVLWNIFQRSLANESSVSMERH